MPESRTHHTSDDARAPLPLYWARRISRELRGPLTAVLGYGEQLADPGLDEATRRAFGEELRQGGKNLLRCLEEFVELSRLRSGGIVARPVPTDLMELLGALVAGHRARAESKGISLLLRGNPGLRGSVQLDPQLLASALNPLLDNAVRFTEHGEVSLRAELSDDGDDGCERKLEIHVRDTGRGVPAVAQPELFQCFSNAAKRPDTTNGPGLGLALCSEAVRLLDGEVFLESSSERGSVFVLRLPVQASAARPAEPAPDSSRRGGRQRKQSLRDRHILLADDSAGDRRLVEFVLRKMGARVTSVENGEEAIAKLRESAPDFDLVLMDMEMPVMNGLQATSQLRQDGIAIPIVALTANAFDDDRDRCLDAGCTSFMTKPIRQRELSECITRHLATDPVR